jgi:hypothetical protein
VITFLLLVFVPIGISAARYYWMGEGRGNWQTADRSSAGLLPPAMGVEPAGDAGHHRREDSGGGRSNKQAEQELELDQ